MSPKYSRVDFVGGAYALVNTRDTLVAGRAAPVAISVHFPSVDGQPALELELAVVDGRPQCRQVRIVSSVGGREVRQLDLSAVAIADLVEQVYGACLPQPVETIGGVTKSVVRSGEAVHLESVAAVRAARRGLGARRITPAFLDTVAEVYRENLLSGPTMAVAATMNIEHSTAAKYVARARAAGKLPPTTPGKRQA